MNTIWTVFKQLQRKYFSCSLQQQPTIRRQIFLKAELQSEVRFVNILPESGEETLQNFLLIISLSGWLMLTFLPRDEVPFSDQRLLPSTLSSKLLIIFSWELNTASCNISHFQLQLLRHFMFSLSYFPQEEFMMLMNTWKIKPTY